jgi:hypothetical protein
MLEHIECGGSWRIFGWKHVKFKRDYHDLFYEKDQLLIIISIGIENTKKSTNRSLDHLVMTLSNEQADSVLAPLSREQDKVCHSRVCW